MLRPATAAGDSVASHITPDGRFILFSSSANDLVPGDNDSFCLDVFLHDFASNTTILVSQQWNGSGGGNGDSVGKQVSTNGRYVLFESKASDVLPWDTNRLQDISVRDLQIGSNILVSVAADGGAANGNSSNSVMTPDGRWVAFVSAATNLVPNDTNGIADLFLYDVVNKTMTQVSAGATGLNATVSSPVLSVDGRYVAFASTAAGLVQGVAAPTRGEIYLYDSVLGNMKWVSTNAAATAFGVLNISNAPSYHPAMSQDGRYVAFKTGWTNGTATPPSDGIAAAIVFLHDAITGSSTIVSTNAHARWSRGDDVYGPEVTPDGRFLVFVSREDLAGTNASVRLWDRLAGTSTLVSANQTNGWTAGTQSHTPVVSEDGRYVVFLSDATDLVPNLVSNGVHIYRRDVLASATQLVDGDADGAGLTDHAGVIPDISADGSAVVFSGDGNLIVPDSNRATDVFLWDAQTGSNVLISSRSALVSAEAGSGASALGRISLSADGRVAAFASLASDLVPGDLNGESDVFVRDLTRGTTSLVSVGTDGNSALGGGSYDPLVSANGRYVLFVSMATNLAPGDTDGYIDIYLRDLASEQTQIISVDSNGVHLGSGDCSNPLMSRDARHIAFRVQSTLYWRDLSSGSVHVVNNSLHFSRPITMSMDGRRLSFFSSSGTLYVWDASAPTMLRMHSSSQITFAAISPAGDRVVYVYANQLYMWHWMANSNALLHSGPVTFRGDVRWSGDGRFLAFATTNNLVAWDTNGATDVYLYDSQTASMELVSMNGSGTGSANGASDWPMISADGGVVLFRSFASDIAPGVLQPPSLVLFDRTNGSNSVVVTRASEANRKGRISRPSASASGHMLAFQSWDPDFVTGDFNRGGDALAIAANGPPVADSDGDSVPDWWTILHFGRATGQPSDGSRAGDDRDGDGLTTYQEFLAGTDPNDAGSVLALQIAPDSQHTLRLSWDALPGRVYDVFAAENLDDPQWELIHNNVWQATTVSVTNTQRYLRVGIGN